MRTESACLLALREPVDEEALPAHLLAALQPLVEADVVSHNAVDCATGALTSLDAPQACSTAHQDVVRRFFPTHPLIVRFARSRDGRPRRISDVPSARFEDLPLYNEVYRPLRLRRDLFAQYEQDGRWVVLGFHRGGREFSLRERRRLERVYPHVLGVARRARAHGALRREAGLARRGIEALGHGWIALGPGGVVGDASPRASRWLERYLGAARSGPLPARLNAWLSRQEDQPGALTVEGADGRLVVQALREGASSLLLLREHGRHPDPSKLAALGLSPRECEVLAWVAWGRTNAEVALILGLQTRTVQKHLEHVFVKIGVENRTAAAARAQEAWVAG